MTEEATNRRYVEAHHEVTIECDLVEPALVPAVFDVLRLNARACGLPDVGTIYIHLSVKFAGQTWNKHIDELRERLNALWLADVTADEVTPIKTEVEE